MSSITRLIITVYSMALNLYPRRFKNEFIKEMHSVFRSSVMDAYEEGILALFLVCTREFIGMPFHIMKEFLHEVQGSEVDMQTTYYDPSKKGSWGDSVMAGFPHLIFAVFIGITQGLTNTKLAATSGNLLALFLVTGLLATMYCTWRLKWPAWSASWYGYAGLSIFIFAILPSQDWNWNPILKSQIFGQIGGLILLVLSLATLLYWLTRRNPIEGLLMSMPVIILYWFPVMEFIPNSIRFWLTVWLFLLPALAATVITRLNNIKNAVWMVLGTSFLCGLPIAYARTYLHNIPEGHFLPPSIGQVAGIFSIQFLAGSALAIGPILGWGLWRLGKKYGQAGRVSARLIVLGMVVNLSGHFGYWWWFSHRKFFTALQISPLYKPDQASTQFMVYVGFAGTLAGAIWLAVLNWRQSKRLSVSLFLVPLVLPLLVMFPIYFGYRIIPAGFSFQQFIDLNVGYIFLIFLAGITWIAMGGWTITHLYAPAQSEGSA